MSQTVPRIRKFVLHHGHGATSTIALATSYEALPRTIAEARWIEVDFDQASAGPELRKWIEAAVARGCVLMTSDVASC